jgi:hypothetical protein
MKQRGRKSRASLAFPELNGAYPRLNPPPFLNRDEREIFLELAASAPHFRSTDAPLLASLAQATVIARRTARNPKQALAWERAVRVQMALCTKLRLTPQSRTYSEKVGRQHVSRPSVYDQMRQWGITEDDDDDWPTESEPRSS